MKWGVCLTGGEAPRLADVKNLLERSDLNVAADSGLDLATDYGVTPDLVVGDMDSIRDSRVLDSFEPSRVRWYPREKDETDTEIGLRLLRERNISKIALIGGGGGRLDHLVAILSIFDRSLPPDIWVTNESYVMPVESSVEVRDQAGKRVSFFPVGRGPWNLESAGLEWPLDSLEWSRGDVGVSNRITTSVMKVSTRSGRILMVGELDSLPGVLI